MQVYFDMNYTSRNDFLEEHRRVLEMRLQPIVREITDSRARTKEELESKPLLSENCEKHEYDSHQLNVKSPIDVFLSLAIKFCKSLVTSIMQLSYEVASS